MPSGSSGSIAVVSATQPASRACAASISELVSRTSPGPISAPTGRTSSPVGITVTTGRARTRRLVQARGGGGRHLDRPQPLRRRQQQLGGADVLADRAHVLVGRGRGPQLGATAFVVHVLAHHHRVEPVGQLVAGVEDREVLEQHRRRLARARGVGRAHRDPVHRGRVVGGRGARRPHRLGGDASHRVGHRDLLDAGPRRAARGLARLAPDGERLGGRDVADERHRSSTTSTSAPPGRPVAGSGTTT